MLTLLRSRLSVRLALLFLVVGVLPLLGVGWAALVTLEQSALDGARRRQDLVGESAGRLVEGAIDRAEETLVTLSRLLAQAFVSHDPSDFVPSNRDFRDDLVGQVSALVEPSGVFLELQYFGGFDTQLLAQVQNPAVFHNFNLESNVHLNGLNIEDNLAGPAVNDPVEFGRPHRDEALSVHADEVSLRLSHPVSEPDGVSGAIVGYVDFQELRGVLARLVGSDVGLEVIDPGGTVLVAAGQVPGAALERTYPFGQGWTVAVRESEAAVRAPVVALRRRVLPWFGGAVLVALALAVLFAAWITRPVTRLRRAAEALERGDLSARAGVDRLDEVGRLGAAFDSMAQALAQLDAAKSEFVATVSHELRTPLTSLRLTVANLLDGVQGEVSDSQRAALDRVGGELVRLTRLVEDLLELARLDAGVAHPRREPVLLRELARSVAEVLDPSAQARSIEVVVTGEGEALADAAMLRRVLTNLLDNAIKFSPEGGTVRVCVEPGAFEVADSGPGVGSDAVFEAFRQEHRDGVAPSGAGLGLAIVRKLVELHGGRVGVRNDGGAIFRVELGEEPA